MGASLERRFQVRPEDAIDFMGTDAARVLSTPRLIELLEMTCRDLLAGFLERGQDSVGVHIEVRHLAATPVGMEVHCKAEITSAEGRRVSFRLEAHDELERIAEGTHQRFIVDVEKFAAKAMAKASRRGQA